MPQGSLKKATSAKSGRVKKSTNAPKKAAPKKLAPKRKAAVKEAMITRKHTAALAASTEKILASKIGHLEILKGTRKELEQKAKGGEQKAKMRTSKDRGATKA